MALDIDKVFRFVQFVANKEMRGWIAPGEFNIAAELAGISAYSKREAVFLQTKKILNDLRPFMKVSVETPGITGLVPYPTSMRHFVTARMDSDFQEITELTQAELGAAMKSSIIAPTVSYPACVQRDTGIQLYPITISADVAIEYLVSPTAPLWNYTVVSGRPVYAAVGGVLGAGASINYEFDDVLFEEIASSILSNVGMNIKDETVTQYGMAFNKAK